MSLFDELEKEIEKRRPVCAVCEWLDTISDDDRRAFDQWLADGKAKKPLWRACCRLGLNIGHSAFGDHVNRHHVPR